MNPLREHEILLTRRQLFGRTATGIGAAALGSLLNPGMASLSAAPDLSPLFVYLKSKISMF